MIDLSKIFDTWKTKIKVGNAFSIKINHFIIWKNNRSAKIQEPAVWKWFQDQFGANAIDVAWTKANNRFHSCEITTQSISLKWGM